MKNLLNREVMIWISFGLLLIGTGIMLNWHFIHSNDLDAINKIHEEFTMKKKIDSVRIIAMVSQVEILNQKNEELKALVMGNRDIIKKIGSLSIQKQYEVYLYTASSTRDYFMHKTGGGHAELQQLNGDTVMITPIENIKDANIKLTELEYVIQERDQYIQMTSNLEGQILNYETILTVKDSIIFIKDSELIYCDTVIASYQKEAEKKERKIKNQKMKTWIIAGAAAAGILIISIFN